MVYEVYKGGKRMVYSEYRECIPDDETLRLMVEAGYEPYIDGKRYKPKTKSKSKSKKGKS